MSIGGSKKKQEQEQSFNQSGSTSGRENAIALTEEQKVAFMKQLTNEQTQQLTQQATSGMTQEEFSNLTQEEINQLVVNEAETVSNSITNQLTQEEVDSLTEEQFNSMVQESFEQKSSTSETLDATAQSGLEGVINAASGLSTNKLAPGLSPETLSAISGVGTGVGGVDPLALSTIQDFASGEFVPSGTAGLERASAFAADQAEKQVSDLFTGGGRSGSFAHAKAVSEGVAGAVSPFAFNFEREEANRQDSANAQKLASAFGLQDVNNADDVLKLQKQLAQLEATGQIDQARREELEAPFRRLGLISGAITSAASILGKTTDTTTGGATTGSTSGGSTGSTAVSSTGQTSAEASGTSGTSSTGQTKGVNTGSSVGSNLGVTSGTSAGASSTNTNTAAESLGVDATQGVQQGVIDTTGKQNASGSSKGSGSSSEFGFKLNLIPKP